jgi:MFS family permease
MNRSWLWLLGARTISTIGSRLTIVAFPLTAVLLLNASPLEMGILKACAMAPFVLFGPFLGAFIDGYPTRKVLVVANFISGAAIAIIPIGYNINILSVPLLAVVAFLAATVSNAEGIAITSYIPQIVDRSRLLIANSQYSSISGASNIGGTALSGFLILIITVPGTIAVDALSFFLSGLMINFTAPAEPLEKKNTHVDPYFVRLRDGFHFTKNNPDLLSICFVALSANLFASVFGALESLFIIRELGVAAPAFAAALTAGAVAGSFGAFLSGKISQMMDFRTILTIGIGLITVSLLCVSLLTGSPGTVAIIFGCCSAVSMFGGLFVNVAVGTLFQSRTPANMLGCVIGFLYSITTASLPIGAVVGGILGDIIGVRFTLVGAAGGLIIVLLYLVVTSVGQSSGDSSITAK